MKIFVGNLAHETTESELRRSFEKFGEVSRVDIVLDKLDGRPKGFGFIEMPTLDHANAAILALNGKDMGGRALTINESRSNANRAKVAIEPQNHVSTDTSAGAPPTGNK